MPEQDHHDFANLAIGWQQTSVGEIPRVDARLNHRDKLGSILVRLGVGRMSYTVPPGLYALGSPVAKSPVVVTANYKLSFDHLRRSLSGLDAWMMVLDTRGINVWCAAGEELFGTDEVVRQVEATRLDEVVTHRKLVLPQLSGPGVRAHEVRKRTGFRVIYGPVRAADLPAFLAAGNRATREMRRVTFRSHSAFIRPFAQPRQSTGRHRGRSIQ